MIVIKVEVAWGASLSAAPATWTWTDITIDLRANMQVSIRAGRADEDGQTTPASVRFILDDSTGKYTPRNAYGLNFPNVRLNTPFRVTFGAGVRTIVFADSFSPSWDDSLSTPIVTVSASGILRRLGQGAGLALSVMRRHIEGLAPSAYWALEDGGSTSVGGVSALVGGTVIASSPSNGFTFGDTSHPIGAVASVRRSSIGASLIGYLPVAASSSVRIDVAIQTPAADATQSTLSFLLATPGPGWGFNLAPIPTDELWHHHRIEVFNVAGTAKADWYIDTVQVLSAAVIGTWDNIVGCSLAPGTIGPVNTDAYSHLAMWSPRISSDTYQAFLGYPGETATARLTRVCSDQGVALTLTGSSAITMGAQPVATFPDLARACEEADGGILSDGGSGGGLTYLARSSRYNLTAAMTIDSSLMQLARPFAAIEDDQRRRNDWTVSRTDGASGRSTDATGPQGTVAVGTYTGTVTIDVQTDDVLPSQASWRVHLGTVEQMRYPGVVLKLHARSELVASWLATVLGSRITLKNLPSQHQPGDVDLIVEGYAEESDGSEWIVTINGGAYDPWRVNSVASTSLGRVETAGCALPVAVASGATTMNVATSSGPLWTTSAAFPADFPLSLEVSGIEVVVSAAVSYLNANPYFESPTNATSWTAVNGATIVANSVQAHEGTQSLLVTPDGVTAVPQTQCEDIAVTTGRSYTLSGWIRAAIGGDTISLNISWLNSSHVFLSSSVISAAPGAGVWTQYGPTAFTAPVNAAFARMTSNIGGTPLATHTWRLDEITLTDGITQIFTVSGVNKALPISSTVKLWKPGVIAL